MGRGGRATAVVVIIVIAFAAYLGRSQLGSVVGATVDEVGSWATKLRDLAAAEPRTEIGLRSRQGESASVFVTLGSGDGDAAFALLIADPDGPPMLVMMPQDLLLAVPGFGEVRLVDALVFGGPELAALAVVNQFGIRLDGVAGLPAGAVSRGLPEPVEIDLLVPLFAEDPDGSVSRIVSAGRADLAPDLVEALLVTRGASDSFEWIQRQGSAWRAILDAVADAPGIADRITALGGSRARYGADLLVTVAADSDVLLLTVPVERAESAAGVESLVSEGDQAEGFIRERLSHLLLRPGGRPRIEVLNGNGRIGTTSGIAEILIRSGFRLVRTDNADNFDFEETLIIAQGSDAEDWGREIVELLGQGLVFLEDGVPSEIADVSIIVGHDIPSGEG